MEEQAEDLKELLQGGVTGATPNVSETVSNNGHKTRIIAITSGKGGVGKTNISVNMAIAYAQLGKKVILIDGDLGMANVNVLMNVVPQYNLMHVINKKKTMKEIILDTEFGIKFIAGANGFSKIANLSVEELEYFAKQFSTLGNADIIIIDTGAGIANNVLQFVAAADEVYVVTTPEPTVLPPSLIANLNPSSIATGWINSTFMSMWSPGITISIPSGNLIAPVTSVVLK